MKPAAAPHPAFTDPIAENSGDPLVVISPDRKLVYANQAARTLFELDEWPDHDPPRCCDKLKMSICASRCADRVIPEGNQVVHDYFVKREGHDAAVYCVSTSSLYDEQGARSGTIHSIKDMAMVQRIIDEQKRTQTALQQGKEKLRAVLDAMADGVFTVDREGRIGHFSPSMERITGWRAGEAAGRTCREVLRGSGCDADCPIAWTFREKKRVERFSETLISRTGTAVPVFVTTAVIRGKDEDEIEGAVCSVIDRTEVEALRKALSEKLPFPEFVGRSPAMLKLFDLIASVCDTDATVLIQGETGTGKELVARAIHQRSERRAKPFIAVNCSALTSTLLESELFGHARGSFTGAIKDKKGKFEAAEGGTLFLDEISEIPLDMQVKLLRFLQSREFERVGETTLRQVDVRIVAATNRLLEAMVRSGAFREDLFYRLHVIPVHVPPLRERREDIPLLVEHFIAKHAGARKNVEGISTRALQCFIAYAWPGNVRELENAVLCATASCAGRRIERSGLPPGIRDGVSHTTKRSGTRIEDTDLRSIERTRIVRRLEANNWHVAATASDLGYSRSTLWRRMKQLEIRLPGRGD